MFQALWKTPSCYAFFVAQVSCNAHFCGRSQVYEDCSVDFTCPTRSLNGQAAHIISELNDFVEFGRLGIDTAVAAVAGACAAAAPAMHGYMCLCVL